MGDRLAYSVCPAPTTQTPSNVLRHQITPSACSDDEFRLGETELAHEDGVVVGTDPAAGMTHLARRLAELRHHALHAHRAEVDVRHRDDVLARDDIADP